VQRSAEVKRRRGHVSEIELNSLNCSLGLCISMYTIELECILNSLHALAEVCALRVLLVEYLMLSSYAVVTTATRLRFHLHATSVRSCNFHRTRIRRAEVARSHSRAVESQSRRSCNHCINDTIRSDTKLCTRGSG